MAPSPPANPRPADPTELVLKAFAMARDSGKPGWNRMTTAVLKNRLLLLTKGQFSERGYGAATFKDFLGLLAAPVRVDTSVQPPVVELFDGGEPEVRKEASVAETVRADLWRAMLDYSSGHAYVWDKDTNQAVPKEEADQRPLLPTVSAQELGTWRNKFAQESREGLSPVNQARLEQWVAAALPTRSLPKSLQGPWNGELKKRVLERLGEWFGERGIPAPTDSVARDPLAGPRIPPDAEHLRSALLRCIRHMTPAELERITVPASALLRVGSLPRP